MIHDDIKIEVAITSAPRHVSTLARTCDSLLWSNLCHQLYIYYDGYYNDKMFETATIIESQHKLGAIGNWARCAGEMIATRCDYIMICQDDIIFCKGAKSCLLRLLQNNKYNRESVVTLYTPRANVLTSQVSQKIDNWSEFIPSQDTWGAQCWLFSANILESVINSIEFNDHACSLAGLDALVYKILGDMKIPCYHHVPSLTHHIGEFSTLGHKLHAGKEAVLFDVNYSPSATVEM